MSFRGGPQDRTRNLELPGSRLCAPRNDRKRETRLPPHRHGRACPGHPRRAACEIVKAWMPGSSPGMTAVYVAARCLLHQALISALIMSAAFSPIMMVGALVLPPISVG